MTSNMPTEHSSLDLGRGWLSVLRPAANLVNRSRLPLGVLVEETSNAILGGYNGINDAMIHFIRRTSPEVATPAESVDLEFQPADDQQVNSTDREHVSTLLTTFRDHNGPFTSEGDDPEEAGHPASVREHGSSGVTLARFRRSWMWMAALIVGLLLLIMVPGLILGVVTRQTAWGIAISGAVAPAVVFFGGLYYHHNR